VAAERILVLNGPNLNLLGRRQPDIYGAYSLEDISARLQTLAASLECACEVRQTNYEGELVGWLHDAWDTVDGIVLNPGALTHYSFALRDAVAAIEPPVIEVHLSHVHARESFRHRSVISAVSLGLVSGLGPAGYELALRGLVGHLRGTVT
jgi:3-dehydroquinate dehydratase-2